MWIGTKLKSRSRRLFWNMPLTMILIFRLRKIKSLQRLVSDDPEIAKINAILDNTIRPGLQMDGGDLQIVSFDGIEFDG